jgi:hypothetical protein
MLSLCVAGRGAESPPGADEIRAAAARALDLLEKSAAESMVQRPNCFTCHNLGLPTLAMAAARARGFDVNTRQLETQVKFTADFLAKNRENYAKGKGQGGQVATAGYALWTLKAGNGTPDDTTLAVVTYLLAYQEELDHWQMTSHRPPSESSHFAATFLAIQGLQTFGSSRQAERIAARLEQARTWLEATPPLDTEDRVFRLWALKLAGGGESQVQSALEDLLRSQREDGGWSQTADLPSDAYATGSALVALHEAGGLRVDHSAWSRGVEFLLRTQLADGSWHVPSRSRPFQTYYESGFPHGPDQFISITGSSWAATALVLAAGPGGVAAGADARDSAGGGASAYGASR